MNDSPKAQPATPEAAALLADLRSRGIELETDGARLRWRPAFLVSAPLAEQIRFNKAELIALLRAPAAVWMCPRCRWPLDSARRCPKCFDRLCVDCGRATGSYFIMRCVVCGHSFQDDSCRGPGGPGIQPPR
jgi:hypothetical protein